MSAIEIVKREVSATFSVSIVDIESDRQSKDELQARQAAMLLAKEFTRYSLPRIARCFGDRDHTVVYHALKRARKLYETDPAFCNKVNLTRQRLVLDPLFVRRANEEITAFERAEIEAAAAVKEITRQIRGRAKSDPKAFLEKIAQVLL